MERIFRSVIQVGGQPEAEDASNNWVKLLDYDLEHDSEEDNKIYKYIKQFYEQMSSPPDYNLVKEYFEKEDDIESVSRLEEIKSAQFYIRTNFLAIAKSILDRQQVKNFVILCRDASAVAEHGRNLDKPINGKKTLKGVSDALGLLVEKMPEFTRIEAGERLEGVVHDDKDEVIEQYDIVSKTDKYAGRNLLGLEPVDLACKGHRKGEFWVHCAFPGELKCESGDALIYDHKQNKRRTIKEIYESQELPIVTSLFREGEKLKLIPAQASHIIENGVQEIFELKLSSGRRTKATENHKFFSINKWLQINELKLGDWIAVPKKTFSLSVNNNYSDNLIKIIGYLIGDGTISQQIIFTAKNDEIRNDFMNCLLEEGYKNGYADFKNPNFVEYFANNGGVHVKISCNGTRGTYISKMRVILEDLGMWGCVAGTKSIPDELFGLSDHQISLLIGALWSTDGSFHVGDHERDDRESDSTRNDIKYYSISRKLCDDIQSLLLRLGINSTVNTNKIKYNGVYRSVSVVRVISRKSKKLFCDLINVVGKEFKQDWIYNRLLDRDDTYYPSEIIPDGSKAIIETGRIRHKSQLKSTVSADVAEYFRAYDGVSEYLDGDLLWERVESITSCGHEMTYDMEVPEHHSFVVDDIVTHNTTLALNYAYNNAVVYGKNILYTILEMPYTQLRLQLYAIHSSHGKFVTEWNKEDGYVGLDYRELRDGELSARDYERLKIIAQDFKANTKGKLYIWRPGDDVTTDDIKRKAEAFHHKHGCDGLVIDHLGLVKPKNRIADHVVSLNTIVRDTRLMALNFARGSSLPIFALFQLNRQGKLRADKNGGQYDMAAISYANEIEKSADKITYTYLNDELRREGKFLLGCMKNRDDAVFEPMLGKIIWKSKRMRHLETSLMDMDNDELMEAQDQLSTISFEDMMGGTGTFG